MIRLDNATWKWCYSYVGNYFAPGKLWHTWELIKHLETNDSPSILSPMIPLRADDRSGNLQCNWKLELLYGNNERLSNLWCTLRTAEECRKKITDSSVDSRTPLLHLEISGLGERRENREGGRKKCQETRAILSDLCWPLNEQDDTKIIIHWEWKFYGESEEDLV